MECCIGVIIKFFRAEYFEQKQSELADEMYISQAMISKSEAGNTCLWKHLYGFSAALSCRVSDLIKPVEDFLDEERGAWEYPVSRKLIESGMYWFFKSNKGKYW